MKKNFRRLLILLLSTALLTGMIPFGTVFAAEKGDKGLDDPVFDEIAKQFADETKDPFAFRSAKGQSGKVKLNSDLPESYDLRAAEDDEGDLRNYVTPVKFQNPFGSCWGFAAIAAAETSLIGEGLATQDIDLSEKHLINFITKPINDPTSPQNGEGMYYVGKNLSLTDKFNIGGFGIFATNLFASGMGPNKEDRDVPEGLPTDIFEYKGLNGEITQNKINGKWEDYCYSDEDDWDMPESLRFKQSYTLEESYILPNPAKNVGDEEEPEYQYDPLGTAAIKEQIMNKRAVEIGFLADNSMPDDEKEGEYISKNWAHYTDTMLDGANHAVTIVGWDDNYPRENFVQGKQPPEDMFPYGQRKGETGGGNGAWLVKNSWGSGEEDFPNKGPATWGLLQGQDKAPYQAASGVHTGYFWLSYYDQSLDKPEALNFTSEVPAGGYYLDQHDFMPVTEVETAELDQEVSMANVFKAEVNEQLEYISFQTSVPGSTVEYEVYLLSPGYKTPKDGIRVASGTAGPYEYGGFHKIEVDDEVVIQKNQSYSIVITLKTPDDEYSINIPTGTLENMASFFGQPTWQKGVINPGESFVDIDGKWYDYTDEKLQDRVFNSMNYFMSLDNFPIKGYCRELPNLNMYITDDNPLKLPPYVIEWNGVTRIEGEIRLRFKKGKDSQGNVAVMPDDPKIDWSFEGDGADKVEMTRIEGDTSRVAVKAIKPGTAFLVVSAEGIGKLVIRIDIPKSGWYDVWDVGDIEYGESEVASVSNFDGSDIPAGTLTYKSANPKVATVSAKGIIKAVDTGKTVIKVYDKKGVEEQIKVRVIKTDQKMKVKGKIVKVKYKTLKKKNVKIARKKAVSVTKAKGKVTYKLVGVKKINAKKKVSGRQYKTRDFFKVSKSGKITIKKYPKKGVKKTLSKGTYKVKVKVTAKGDKNYKKMAKNAVFKIKVK